MPIPVDTFSDPPLPAAPSEEFYDLYKAALEWRLAAPILIRSAEDIISADRWRDRVQPFHHQVRNLITFCRLAPAVLLADEVGLGKTISAGLILSELIARRRVVRALVVCPRVLCDQWVRELTDKFRIEATAVTGAELVAASNGTAPVVVTTYETAGRYFDDNEMPTDAFQMLILDEAHRLRNLHGTSSPPQFAVTVQEAIRCRWFAYVLMLTATPVQNRFTDIYSLIDLLTLAKGHTNPFGNLKSFRSHYLLRGHDGRRLQKDMADRFRQTLNNYVTRTRRVDADLPFPSRHVSTVRVKLTSGEREFDRIVGRLLGGLNSLTQSSLGQALMSSPAALAAQLESMSLTHPQLTSAAVRARAVAEGGIPPAKLARLFTLCDELRAARSDWRVVVFTRRRETQEMIRCGLMARGIPVGLIAGGRPSENRQDTTDFLADPPRVHVLVSTDAGAEGVNLQEANWLVNYDLPWNPMILEQRIGRVQRLGSPHREVFIQNFVAAGTVEEVIVARLLQRLMTVTETVGDLESILVAAGSESEDDSGERFETQVRDLVVRSLLGQDAAREAEQLAASVERAKQEYDSNCGQMNRDLGALDASAATAPPPRFDRPRPSLSAEEFVRRALSAEGHKLREVQSGLFQMVQPNGSISWVAVSLRAADFSLSNGNVASYIPGQAPFEQLAERWSNRCMHRVLDLRVETNTAAEQLARQWCSRYPEITFLSCTVRNCKPLVNGRVLVRSTAENRVDQHQRLVEYPIMPEGHNALPEGALSSANVLEDKVALKEVAPRAAQRVHRAVAEDQELNMFANYYTARRINELSRAGANPHLRQRVEDTFSVTSAAEVVGFRGVCYEEAIIDIRFMVGSGEYAATLQAVPVSGQIIERPTEDHCLMSDLRMPYGVLARCDRTRRLFPRHLLHESELSRRLAVRDHTLLCEVTGRLVIDDEVECCAVSGRRAVSMEFVTCATTGQRILRSESGTSIVSGVIVRSDLLFQSDRPPHRQGLVNELVQCQVSGQRLLIDEVGISAVSGRVVDLTALVTSENSGRLGLENETVRCQETDRLLLQDEVDLCSVSGKRVDMTLLDRSQVSGCLALKQYLCRCTVTRQLAIRNELVQCSLTGELALPNEIETCVVSGLRMIRQRMKVCELTKDWLSPSVAARSDVSGRIIRPDLIQRSDRFPGRAGLPDEMGICEISGNKLLLEEMARSVVSNRLIDRKLLEGTGDRLAHSSEFVQCEVSGQWLLPSDTGICELTNTRAAIDQLVQSELSARLVLRRETVRCSQTNRLVARDEVETCCITGLLALSSELETCDETGVRVLRSQLVQCDETGAWIVPKVAGRSDYRPRWIVKRLLRQSAKPPGRWGTANEVRKCAVTGKRMLLDEMEMCSVTNLFVDRDLLVSCGMTGSLALRDQTERCAWIGKRIIKRFVGVCELTRMRIAEKYLNQDGMLTPLAELLDGERPNGVVSRNDLIQILKQIDSKFFADVVSVDAVVSPVGDKMVVCATLKRGWFSRSRYAGFLLSKGMYPRIGGDLVLGYRTRGEWQLESTVSFD